MKRVLPVLAIAAVLAAVPVKAWATSFNLTVNNLGMYTGPYVQVTLTLVDAHNIDVLFSSLSNGGNTYLMGGQGTVAVNVKNPDDVTVSNIANSNPFPGGFVNDTGDVTLQGPGNEDGFGSFNKTFDTFDGFTHSSSQVSFRLTDNVNSWVTFSDAFELNDSNFVAAAHIFVCANPCNQDNGAVATGYARNGPTPTQFDITETPEPTTMALFGTGLLFAASRARRHAKRSK